MPLGESFESSHSIIYTRKSGDSRRISQLRIFTRISFAGLFTFYVKGVMGRVQSILWDNYCLAYLINSPLLAVVHESLHLTTCHTSDTNLQTDPRKLERMEEISSNRAKWNLCMLSSSTPAVGHFRNCTLKGVSLGVTRPYWRYWYI